MKIIKSYLMLPFALLVASCSDENREEEQKVVSFNFNNNVVDSRIGALYSTHNTISVDVAKYWALNAEQMFSCSNSSLKSSQKNIENVLVLGYKPKKSGLKSVGYLSDTCVYVVNFVNNNGFAIIGADDRLGNPVLAYVDNGNFNPNFFDEEHNKILFQIQEYIYRSVNSFESSRDSLQQIAERYLLDNCDIENQISLKSGSSSELIKMVSYKEVLPLIKTAWGQKSPYNQYLTTVKGLDCPVGCVAVATAQVMAYWRCPEDVFDWSEITKKSKIENLSNNGKSLLQVFLYFVAEGINSNYTLEKTSANLNNVVNYLKQEDYQADMVEYTADNVKNALNLYRPVIMEGWKTEDFISGNGHAWITDGYKSTKYIMTIPVLSRKIKIPIYDDYFHHNWGWDGTNNGWYKSGIFDTGKYDSLDAGVFSWADSQNYQFHHQMLIVYK